IILFVLIVLGVILYRNVSNNRYAKMAEAGNTAIVVQGFLDEMIPHHQEAVDSSLKVMNDLGITDGQVRIFAANVVDTQSFEISRMENIYREFLLKEYIPTVTVDAKNPHAMMGDTSQLKGDELAKTYTKDMIKHHKGAIDAAQDYVKLVDKIRKANEHSENGLTVTNSHPAIDATYELAQQIIDTQTKEIEVMKGWKF
ncbi:DUF305 domain-containing protein, partial [Candidatus Parcubacteria bacterium]|nr:DUF305 domain-containing protein [Candidatus Parcubacteria bacterium]